MKLRNNGSNKVLVNDLSFESAKLAVGNSSLSRVVNDGELFSEFAGLGLSLDAQDYLISTSEQVVDPAKELDRAKATLQVNGITFDESMSDELVLLMAEQYVDNTTNVQGNSYNKSEGVLVIVQQCSNQGRWYTVKDANDKKMTFWYDVETIFEQTNGLISGLKVMSSTETRWEGRNKIVTPMMRPVLLCDMEKLGFFLDGSYVRVILKSSAFISGTEIDGVVIDEVPAMFHSKVLKDKTIVTEDVSYVWDNLIDVMPGICVLPSESDTTAARVAEMRHDANIITGSGVITTSMQSEDMDAYDRDMQIALEKEDVVHTRKVAVQKLMRPAIGQIARLIIDMATTNIDGAKHIVDEEQDRIAELLRTMYQIKTVTGKGVRYEVYLHMKAIHDAQKAEATKVAKAQAQDYVIANIAMLNEGSIVVADLNNEEAIEIMETAAKYGRALPECFITNKTAYNALSVRVKAIKFGAKVEEAKTLYPKEIA